jgi:hypothetical protein|tara:strand:- start:10452 stop:11147 length:696 start_codon:yes stop_codon:yes gene_type:complete
MLAGFDIISDLNLTSLKTFIWEGKPTSLFCIIPGNISSNLDIVYDTLAHLSKLYRGVFFIDGGLEMGDPELKDQRVEHLSRMANKFKNVSYLNTNVIVVDGIAVIGCNGWFGNYFPTSRIEGLRASLHCATDRIYLQDTLAKLQLHLDIKKIIVVSNSVPAMKFYFGETPEILDEVNLNSVLAIDTEMKIVAWVFGNHHNDVNATIEGVHYINNGRFGKDPYWPKRLEVEI